MKDKTRYRFLVLYPAILCAILILGGCEDNPVDATSEEMTFTGTPVAMGNGMTSSFVTLDGAGAPIELGLTLTEDALTGLATEDVLANTVIVPFPTQASSLPFKDIVVVWQPHGHGPAGVYDAPHFDIAYLLTLEAERATITYADSTAGLSEPDPSLVPSGYVSTRLVLPTIGVPWIDITAPEFSGQPFTRTVLWQFWKGNQTAVETVIGKAFLETKQTTTDDIKQPAAFSKAGLFPTKYSIRFDDAAKEWIISLEGLINH